MGPTSPSPGLTPAFAGDMLGDGWKAVMPEGKSGSTYCPVALGRPAATSFGSAPESVNASPSPSRHDESRIGSLTTALPAAYGAAALSVNGCGSPTR